MGGERRAGQTRTPGHGQTREVRGWGVAFGTWATSAGLCCCTQRGNGGGYLDCSSLTS